MDFCFGMQYLVDVVDLELRQEVESFECSYGIRQVISQEEGFCGYTTYQINSLLTAQLLNVIEENGNLIRWSCNFDSLKLVDTQFGQSEEDPPMEEEDGSQPIGYGDKGYDDEFFATEE